MSGESFPNTPNIDQGQSGPDDGGYGAADPEQVTAAMDAVAQAEGLKNIPSSHVTEGTEFGVNAELEAAADKILAEADAKEASAPTQETLETAPTTEAPAAPTSSEAPAPMTTEAPVPEVAAATPVVESPAPVPAAAETPVAEATTEQPAAEVQAPIAPENTNINLAGAQQEAKSEEKKIECFLPDGSHFSGTPEEYNQAVKDYLENIRDLMR